MSKIDMTLAYFIQGDKILLPLKKKKIGKGKHNGVGGRVEAGESIEYAMVRECTEEVGLIPTEYEYAAEITCNNTGINQLAIVNVYLCSAWEGTLIETDEMKPYWFDINAIPYESMMDDDKYWLPLVLSGKKIKATFELDKDYVMTNYNVEEAKTLAKVNC